jgi:hypothetical protein
MPLEPIEVLIARSSLGRLGVRRLARSTTAATARDVLKRAELIAQRDFSSALAHRSLTTDTSGVRRTGPAQKETTPMSGRRTSPKAAKAASKVLRDGRTSSASKTAAGSALSQRSTGKKGK